MNIRLAIALIALLTTCASIAAAEWEHLEDCELVPSFLNDGDSFLIRTPKGEFVFRLYAVDCPEQSDIFPERISEQAKYFGTTNEKVVSLGRVAADFTARHLSGKFSVHTQWRDAMGQSKRYAALIVKDSRLLSEVLAENGLVRIHGFQIAGAWQGKDAAALRGILKAAESRAKQAKRGGWSSDPSATAPTATPPKKWVAPHQLININRATQTELETLPQIGPSKAKSIIDGRPFKHIESIRKVNGIGDATMLKLKPLITVIEINAPRETADHYRKESQRYRNRWVDIRLETVVDVNWPAPDGFVVLQAITAADGTFGGAIPLFFPEEKLEDILRYYGDKDPDETTRTKAIFYNYNGEDVLVIPKT